MGSAGETPLPPPTLGHASSTTTLQRPTPSAPPASSPETLSHSENDASFPCGSGWASVGDNGILSNASGGKGGRAEGARRAGGGGSTSAESGDKKMRMHSDLPPDLIRVMAMAMQRDVISIDDARVRSFSAIC